MLTLKVLSGTFLILRLAAAGASGLAHSDPGGRRILPATTLNVNYFCLILKQTLPNLVNFLKIIWQQFNMKYISAGDLTFPWQSYFDKHVFQNFDFPHFKIQQKLSSSNFLNVFRSFYGVSIPFNYFRIDIGQFLEAKMTAVKKLLRNYYVLRRHQVMMQTSKEIF